MDHFAHKGIDCATPIKDRKGFTLKELCGRPAALISFLDGISIKDPNIENCRDLGRALAEMHLAGSDFKMSRKNDFSLSGWKKLAIACDERADECAPGLSKIIHDEIEFLSKNWPTKLPNGIIHGDLFPDNVFFLDDRLSGLIDYYFACTDMLVYDVSICLNAWCFDLDGSFDAVKAIGIIEEYNKPPLRYNEAGLIKYLDDGRLSIDNNHTERIIRKLVMARNNFLFADTVKGAKALCLHFSLIQTAIANGLEPYKYYEYILDKLPYCETVEDYEALLPWNLNKDALKKHYTMKKAS